VQSGVAALFPITKFTPSIPMEFYYNCVKLDTLITFLTRTNMKAPRTSEVQETSNFKPKTLIYPVNIDPRK